MLPTFHLILFSHFLLLCSPLLSTHDVIRPFGTWNPFDGVQIKCTTLEISGDWWEQNVSVSDLSNDGKMKWFEAKRGQSERTTRWIGSRLSRLQTLMIPPIQSEERAIRLPYSIFFSFFVFLIALFLCSLVKNRKIMKERLWYWNVVSFSLLPPPLFVFDSPVNLYHVLVRLSD